MVQLVASLSALLGQVFVMIGYGCVLIGVLSLLGSLGVLSNRPFQADKALKAGILIIAGSMLVNYASTM